MKDALASVEGLLAELDDEQGQIGVILRVPFPRVVQALYAVERAAAACGENPDPTALQASLKISSGTPITGSAAATTG
ncbi:MAG TPA: hypothetical protein PK216_02570 [Aquimonas sp.]|nr:hypothetical protein [Aquimonas sp.]